MTIYLNKEFSYFIFIFQYKGRSIYFCEVNEMNPSLNLI